MLVEVDGVAGCSSGPEGLASASCEELSRVPRGSIPRAGIVRALRVSSMLMTARLIFSPIRSACSTSASFLFLDQLDQFVVKLRQTLDLSDKDCLSCLSLHASAAVMASSTWLIILVTEPRWAALTLFFRTSSRRFSSSAMEDIQSARWGYIRGRLLRSS